MTQTQLDQYAVVGNPIAHSKSPDIHAAFAAQTNQAMMYDKKLIAHDRFTEDVSAFWGAGGKGLNVTMPFKEEAYRSADSLTDRAKYAGAVNTLARQSDGCILGDNTDGAGMIADIHRQAWAISKKRVLILGAGGAVRGVLLPLLVEHPAVVTIANRTVAKAEVLVDVFAELGAVRASSFEGLMGQQFDLVINGTSVGLSGDMPALPDGILAPSANAYDMIYAQTLTPFLRWAKAQGVQGFADGLGMLVSQAAESFYLWRQVKPDISPVMEMLRPPGKALE